MKYQPLRQREVRLKDYETHNAQLRGAAANAEWLRQVERIRVLALEAQKLVGLRVVALS